MPNKKDQIYEPILYKLANRGFPVFCRVMSYLRNHSDNIAETKHKQDAEFFIVAESDNWDLYTGVTSGVLFQATKAKMRNNFPLTKDIIASKMADFGYESEEQILKDKIHALIMIKPFLEKL